MSGPFHSDIQNAKNKNKIVIVFRILANFVGFICIDFITMS